MNVLRDGIAAAMEVSMAGAVEGDGVTPDWKENRRRASAIVSHPAFEEALTWALRKAIQRDAVLKAEKEPWVYGEKDEMSLARRALEA